MAERLGFYNDISNEDYHSGPGYSSSQLKNALISAYHLKYYMDHPKSFGSGVDLGTVSHEVILDPASFKKNWMTAPAEFKTKSSKGYYTWAKALEDEKQIALASHVKIAHEIKRNMPAEIRKTIEDSTVEQSLYWKDSETGLLLKVRPDMRIDGGILLDLKTTSQGADLSSFSKTISKFSYHLSAAMYLEGATNVFNESYTDFRFIVSETLPPYQTAHYTLDFGSLEKGKELFKRAKALIKKSIDQGKWGGYPAECQSISIPGYAFDR